MRRTACHDDRDLARELVALLIEELRRLLPFDWLPRCDLLGVAPPEALALVAVVEEPAVCAAEARGAGNDGHAASLRDCGRHSGHGAGA